MSSDSTILLAGGDASSRARNSSILREAGYTVAESPTGAGTLAFARANAPGAVVLARGFPDLSGSEVCAALKAAPETGAIPVIEIGGGADCGADASLAEPADPSALVALTRALLRAREAEDKLRAAGTDAPNDRTALYRRMLETVNDGVCVTDTAGRILFANQRLVESMGYPMEQVVGSLCFDYVAADDRDRVRGLFREAFESGVMRVIEFRAMRASNTVAWMRLSGTLIHGGNGEATGALTLMTDITAERNAFAVLETERSRLDAILRHMPAGVLIAEAPSGDLIYANEECSRILGRPLGPPGSAERWRDWKLWRLDGSPVPFEELPLMRSVLRGEIVNSEEYIFERAGGGRGVGCVNAAPVYDAAGKIAAGVVAFWDITSHKRADEELLQSNRKLGSLVDSNLIGIAFLGATGIADANNTFLTMLGYTREDLCGGRVPWRALLPPEYHEWAHETAHQVLTTGYTVPAEAELLRYDGSRLPVLVGGALVGGREWVCFVLDISERKRMERALRISEERFRIALQDSPIVVWAQDLDLRYTWVYNAPDWFQPRTIEGLTDVDVFGPQGAGLEAAKRHVLAAGKPYRYECELTVEGAPHYYYTCIEPVRDSSGRITGVTGACVDVTERKALERRVQEAEKLESIGRLGAGIAHDFNNLLGGIMGGASFALDLLPFDHPVRSLLDIVLESSQRAAHLTGQLAAYAGKSRFVAEPLDLSALVAEMRAVLRSLVPAIIEFELELAADLPAVEADPALIRQVIVNLLLNGVEAIPPGCPGIITVRTMQCDRSAGRTKRLVALEVRDSGCGIDPDTRSRIFDPFFTTKFIGRGLGLAAVAGIVRLHHGEIEVDSALGKGSGFAVLLPAAEPVTFPK